MGRTRTIRFDATRAFSATVISIGLLAAAFAAGFRVGQEVPLAPSDSTDVALDQRPRSAPDALAPLRAPEQRIPIDTYTFYEQTRTLTREPSEAPAEPPAVEPTAVDSSVAGDVVAEQPGVRVLEREPIALGVPAPVPLPGPAVPGSAVTPSTAPHVAPVGSRSPEPAAGPPSAPPIPRDLDDDEPVADPGAIQRVAVVAGPR